MGYQTYYEMHTVPDGFTTAVVERISALCGGYSPFEDSCKWYDHELHVRSVTRDPALRDVLVVLDGDGEEAGDVWRKAFLNGDQVWLWKCEAKRPDVPAEITALVLNPAAASERGKEMARKAAIAKLTPGELRALGIEP